MAHSHAVATAVTLLLALSIQGCSDSRSGNPPKEVVAEPAAPTTIAKARPTLRGVSALVSGLDHSCALSDGKVHCWGHGLDQFNASSEARHIADLPTVALLRSGGRRVCAVTKAGALYCWGERLGEDSGGKKGRVVVHTPGSTPPGFGIRWGGLAKLDYGKPIADVQVGMTHICAVTTDQELYCWGSANGGQLAKGSPIDQPQRLARGNIAGLEVGHGWTCYSAGGKHTCRGRHPGMKGLTQQQYAQWPGWHVASCGVSNVGDVFCEGRLKMVYGGKPMPGKPGGEQVQIDGLADIRQLTVGWGHACALRKDDTVWCWGDNSYGQMLGKAHQRPSQIDVGGAAKLVAAGMYHTCALLAGAGEVACWGHDKHGQAGGDSTVSKIRVGAPLSAGTVRTIKMSRVIKRDTLLARPAPKNLTGTKWHACLDGSCETCTYSLEFAPKNRFLATGKCKLKGPDTVWRGRYTRKGNHIRVRERPTESGAVWKWRLHIKGHMLVGERFVKDLAYPIKGELRPASN